MFEILSTNDFDSSTCSPVKYVITNKISWMSELSFQNKMMHKISNSFMVILTHNLSQFHNMLDITISSLLQLEISDKSQFSIDRVTLLLKLIIDIISLNRYISRNDLFNFIDEKLHRMIKSTEACTIMISLNKSFKLLQCIFLTSVGVRLPLDMIRRMLLSCQQLSFSNFIGNDKLTYKTLRTCHTKNHISPKSIQDFDNMFKICNEENSFAFNMPDTTDNEYQRILNFTREQSKS